MSRRQFLALIVPLLVVLLGFVVIGVLERTGAVGTPPWDEGFARYVRTTLAYEFVGGVEEDRAAWEAYFASLNAYVQYFDRHAVVVPPWDVVQSRIDSGGQYAGIGVRTETAPNEAGEIEGMRITGVKPGGPADKAGVLIDDVILAVEGRSVADLVPKGGMDRLRNMILGPEGTPVRLTLRSPGEPEREVEVVRESIDTGSVFGVRVVDEEHGIGYVRLSSFNLDTGESFAEAVRGLLKKGIRGLVLDLRQNRGGILPQAVEVADAFVDSGIIVRVRGRGDSLDETIVARKERTVDARLPLAVLVDAGSASASEILAGALQDHRRAVLVGERTFGKFLVQTVEEVPMEIGSALFKRTSAIYETPLGHSYQRRGKANEYDPLAGIKPDLLMPMTAEERAKLHAIFQNEYFAAWNPKRKKVHEDFDDRWLAAAVSLLSGRVYYPPLLPAQ